LQSRSRIAFSLIVVTLFASLMSFPVHAPGESYSFSQSVSRIQETNTQSITFVLNVTTTFTGVPYQFTWTVTDPSGGTATATTQVTSTSTFTTSRDYPTDFATTVRYVGNYTISITQNTPPPSSNPVKTSTFEVGLTDSENYQRTQPVAILAQGYQNAENITITVGRSGSPPLFSTTRLANSGGLLSYVWPNIPASAPIGTYNVTLTGTTTVKAVRDIQAILIASANVTILQLSITQNSLMRSQTENFRFAPTYPNLAQVRTGSATIRITESDGLTTHVIAAFYRSNIGQFEGTYQIPLDSNTDAWAASIDIGNFNDGYGNTGPSSSVTRAFFVLPATLTVTPSKPNSNYTTGGIIVINAKVVTPSGANFTSGTVTATTHDSSIQIGSPLRLSYDQTQGKWVGSYTVNSTSPAGIWFIQVNATDSYGNSGYGSTSTLVTVPPVQQPPPPQTSAFNYLWIVVIALVAALAVLASFIVYRRGRMVRRVLRVDLEAIHAEAKKVENNEFFKNVQEQLKEQKNNPQNGADRK
jgi:hypothetical protein